MKAREERIEFIRHACKAADRENVSNYIIRHWRGTRLNRRIIRLDSDYLMFRIENSRTEIQQLAYLKKKNLPENLFNDPESYAAQKAQEEILLEMVVTKGKDLLDDLSKRKQDDPCIITYDGYLVNGNRRTAALKKLDERYIECVVLPEDATPKDIYALEQQLQISQDFREEYHWINELKNIRRGREDKSLGFSEKELAYNLRMEIPELRKKIIMLELVDAFLLWKGIKKQYDYPKLDDAEEVFRQLEKALRRYSKDRIKLERLRNEVFTLIEHRPLAGRLYMHVTALIKNFDQIQEKLTEEQDSSDEPNQEKNENCEMENDLLSELIGGIEDVKNTFNRSENASENANKLLEAIADVNAENKERRNTEAVYEGVSTALRELQGLIIDDETIKVRSVVNKLKQIIETSERLLREASIVAKK